MKPSPLSVAISAIDRVRANAVGHPSLDDVGAELWVAFDLDEVLANIREQMAAGLSAIVGRQFHWREFDRYDMFAPYMDVGRFHQMLLDNRVLETCPADEGAVETVRAIREAGAKVAVVTSRGFHPRALEVTQTWMAERDIEVDHLSIVPLGHTKVEALSRLPGQLLGYVDDYLVHLDSVSGLARERGTDLYVIDRPWNQGDDRFGRLGSALDYADRMLDRIAATKTQPSRRAMATI